MSHHRRVEQDRADMARGDLGDERRDFLRITDELLFDYRLDGEPDQAAVAKRQRISDDTISTFFAKPAADLLTHGSAGDGEAQLAQWLMKIDWALEIILKTLSRMSPDGIPLPSLTEVNISAGGLRFPTTRAFQEADVLDVSLVLPPFTPICAKAEVTRVTPDARDSQQFNVAARFTTISPEDRERLIRHILLLQAERIRSRQGREVAG